jgi:hypothetical protein
MVVLGPASIFVSAIGAAIWATAFWQVSTENKIGCLITICLLAMLVVALPFPALGFAQRPKGQAFNYRRLALTSSKNSSKGPKDRHFERAPKGQAFNYRRLA